MFLERLDKPVLNTTYYVPNNNVNDMPNCTKYCHDRSQEACENVNLELFKDRGTRGFPSAENWLKESALPTGNNLKQGSVACARYAVRNFRRVRLSWRQTRSQT